MNTAQSANLLTRILFASFVCVASAAADYSPRVGQTHPDFILPKISDRAPVSLAQFRGKKVILIQFASCGEIPVELLVNPSGAEIAKPRKKFPNAAAKESPDPRGRITRDSQQLISGEVTVVPPKINPGGSCRVHIVLRPNVAKQAHWNNESAPLLLWVNSADDWLVDRQQLEAELPEAAASDEPRHLEFEATAPKDVAGPQKLTAFALYYVCNDENGTCQFLRRDFEIEIDVGRHR